MARETPTIAASALYNNSYSGEDIMFKATGTTGRTTAVPKFGGAVQYALPEKEKEMGRRVIQIFIADPDERVPLEDCMLYQGTPFVSDLTDQELYFELEIKALLDAHNVKRAKVRDKKVKDREEFLEPIKVRDLKMCVSVLAQL